MAKTDEALNAEKERLAAENLALKAELEILKRRLEECASDESETSQQLRTVNQELEAFTYTVSHDLRAPLRAMKGFTQAFLEDYGEQLDATGRDYLERVVQSAERLDEYIVDLLSYSRLIRHTVHPRPLNLAHVIQEALNQMADQIKSSGGTVQLKGAFPVVIAHEPVLIQVLANLIGNALKFVSPDVPPRVTISTENKDSHVRVFVQDNGIGIPEEQQEKIFNVFERLHPADEYPGTGIGLAIVHKGMQRLSGSVGVESAPGQGSRFWIELPAAENNEPKS